MRSPGRYALEASASDLELSRTRHLSTFEPCKRTNTYGYTVLKQLSWYGLNLNVQLFNQLIESVRIAYSNTSERGWRSKRLRAS